jgi:hypothetical protein
VRFWIERVVARQHGGDDRFMNLALSCPWRNRYKGTNLSAIDPESQLIVPLFHPRTQDWDEHFFLDGFVIAGLTPTGRPLPSCSL